jgi:hypothetical protein
MTIKRRRRKHATITDRKNERREDRIGIGGQKNKLKGGGRKEKKNVACKY